MMKKSLRLLPVLAGIIISGLSLVKSQVLVESVAAIVGNEVIYLSELENTVADLKHGGDKTPIDELRCSIFQQMLINKLFLD